MTNHRILDELIALARENHPGADFGFLANSIYSENLTEQEQPDYLRLIALARSQQAQKPLLETTYYHLLHLYVLNGSRLDLLRMMDRRLRGLAEGQGTLLLVSGASGTGKTSLVLAFRDRMQQLGLDFIAVQCSEQENTTYGVWQDVARSAAAKGISIEQLSAPIGGGSEVQSAQQIKRSLADWLAQCSTQRPLVILLDDLHWADVDSLEILSYLTAKSAQVPVLFIATYRSEASQDTRSLNDYLPKWRRNQQVDLIHLRPLNRGDVMRLVTAYHGPCSPELSAYLLQRAEGHPLFTVELLHDLISQKLLAVDHDGYWLPPEQSVPVPAFLKQLIMQRVSRLGKEVEQLLTVGAVAGESWQLKVVESIVSLTEAKLLEALENALTAELLTIEDDKAEVYRFSHGLVREVLYTGQLVRRRKRIHEQIATHIEQQQPSNIFAIAHHYSEAEQWVKAAQYCITAGERAIQQFAFYSGLQWYQLALHAAERAGNVLAPAFHLAIYGHLGRTHQALEQRQEAELAYSRMRDVAQSNADLVAEGQALVNLANIRIAQYQFDLVEKTAHEARKIGEQTGDERLLAQIHMSLSALFIFRGQLERSTYHLQQARTRVEKLDDATMMSEILKFWGYVTIWAGQYREAETYSRSLLDHASESVDPVVKLSGYQNLGWSQIETGQYREAYSNFLTVIEMDEMSKGHHHILPRLLNMMGYLHLELGGAQEALGWDQQALAASWITQSQGNYEMRRYSLLNIATDYLHLGKLEEAQETIAQFEAITEASESVRFRYFNRYQLLMSEFFLAQRLYDQAIELAQEARSLAKSNGVLKNIAKSHWFEGQAHAGLRRFDEALNHLERGVSMADEIQHGSLRWKIRLSLAGVLQKAGKSSEEVIRQASELMHQTTHSLAGSPLEAVFLASRWVKLLKNLEQPPTLEKPAYPAGLTQREVEILGLVAKGATNQQVADVLHISVRTVNTHMTNILNKTGCENRTAASAFAIQHNLLST